MTMSMSVLTVPDAGWYPDPLRESAYRWWDGATWTVQTHEEVAVELQPTPALEPPPVLMPLNLFASAPVLEIAPPAARPDARRAKTRWIPLLSAYPVVYPIAVLMITGLAYAGGAASSIPTLIVVAAVVAVLALIPAFVFAANDRRDLAERGFAVAGPGWLALFPPIGYLIARRRMLAER
jgi:hypothetical protein